MAVDLAIGFFDGFHRGHRRLVGAMVRHAAANAARSVVFTFREHPLEVLFSGSRAPALVLPPRERLAALAAFPGVDEVVAVRFTPRFAAMEPERFAAFLRRRFPGLGTVFCGRNWTFGEGGRGNAATLARLGFSVRSVPYAVLGGEPVSSTRVRAALADGDVALAERLLGGPCRVFGRVRRGKGLGRKLGAPTLNIEPEVEGPFAHGVYRVSAPCGAAAANFGCAPTAGAAAWPRPVWELHFLDGADLSALGRLREGSRVEFRVEAFVRPERRFRSFKALSAAIKDDFGKIAELGRGRQ